MTPVDLLMYWPRITAAFIEEGATPPTLAQAEAIFLKLAPIFQHAPSVPPVPPPVLVPPVEVPPPVEVTPYTAAQIMGFYRTYLGRDPESSAIVQEWMRNPRAEQEIRESPEAQAYTAAHAPHSQPHGTGTQIDPIVAMSSDPAQIARDVHASLAFFDGGDDKYWIDKASHAGMFSNRLWYLGWNKYWEDRCDPTNTGSANPTDAGLPAVHR